MQIYVFDKNLNRIGLIDQYSSLIWTRSTSTAGNFELTLNVDSNSINLLQKENIICKSNDLTECAFIEKRTIEENNEGVETLVITGRFIPFYFNRRIIWGIENINSTSETAMRKLVDSNCINVSSDRKIPLLKLGNFNNFQDKVNYQVSYGNLHEELENISIGNDINFKIITDLNNKSHIFTTYKGIDRTVNQSVYPHCIFSADFDNVYEQSYTETNENYRNVALIGGEGEGAERKLTSIGNTKGLDRYELFVDARDIQPTNEDDSVIPHNEYIKLLIQRGNDKLSEMTEVKTFESKVNVSNANLVYKSDFDLGDYVTCQNRRWGITIDVKITEIEEIYNEDGIEINVTFGDAIPNIMTKIKAKMR